MKVSIAVARQTCARDVIVTHVSKSMRMWQAMGSTFQPPGMRATRCCSTSRRVHAHAATASPGYCSVAAARDVSLILVSNHPLALCSLLLLDVSASEYALGRWDMG